MKKWFLFATAILFLFLSACGNDNTISCSNCSEPISSNAQFCSKCGNSLNNSADNTQSAATQPKEITREELLLQLGGILEVDFEDLGRYLDWLYDSTYYIECKIEEVGYSSLYKTYQYILGESFQNEIFIHNEQRFDEGDYVYVSVRGLDTKHVIRGSTSISKSKEADIEYMSVEEYINIYKALNKTKFKTTGYIFDAGVDSDGQIIYLMYASEEAYIAGMRGRRILFLEEQTNIVGKKIQVIGSGESGYRGLSNCSVVSD